MAIQMTQLQMAARAQVAATQLVQARAMQPVATQLAQSAQATRAERVQGSAQGRQVDSQKAQMDLNQAAQATRGQKAK